MIKKVRRLVKDEVKPEPKVESTIEIHLADTRIVSGTFKSSKDNKKEVKRIRHVLTYSSSLNSKLKSEGIDPNVIDTEKGGE